MTLQQLLVEGTEQLNQAGVGEAQLDARYLLLDAYGLTPTSFLLKRNDELVAEEAAYRRYHEMLQKRCLRIPLQYILGVQEFMGLEFKVDERVLIPRQDTEDMVELTLKEYPGRETCILDMCTGSGCIAISLAKLGGYDRVVAVDLSEGALEVTRENARKLDVTDRLTVLQSDLYEQAEAIGQFGGYDVIISNPPYIPTQVIAGLSPEVRDYEPVLALDGTEDGLYFYRKLANESGRFLKPGGTICLEIGYDQAEAVSGLLRNSGYDAIKVIKDTPGLDRIVKAKYIGGSHV